MKISKGDIVKIIDWNLGSENEYQYLGKADDWYCKRGYSRKFKDLNDSKSTNIILPDSFLKSDYTEIVIIDHQDLSGSF